MARLWVGDVEVEAAQAGQSIALAFDVEVDCTRGDLIAGDPAPDVADQFEADLVWLGDEPLLAGRQYELRLATQTALATLQAPKREIDMASFAAVPAKTLHMNGVGVCDFWTDRPLVFAPYA